MVQDIRNYSNRLVSYGFISKWATRFDLIYTQGNIGPA